MKTVQLLLIVLALTVLTACSRTVNSISVSTEAADETDSAEAFSDSSLTQAESDFIKGIFDADTFDFYTGVSIYARKQLNDSVSVILYSLSSMVGSQTHIQTFCNQIPVFNEVIGSESDADYSLSEYRWTEFKTSDTVLFTVTSVTDRVKDTSIVTPDGWMKEGYSFEDVETVVDSVSYGILVSPKGVIDTVSLK